MSAYVLNKKTVIITGASGGFGSELTSMLIKEYNCRVIGIGRTREKMEALCDSLGAMKSRFRYYLFDTSDRQNWVRFAKTLKEKQITPDLLINNAGIMPPFKKFEDEDGELCKRVIDVNLMSVIYGCEAMIPLLKGSVQGGIVNIASSSAFSPSAGTAIYSASKAAVKNFSMSLAEELKGTIYVGTVCPGFSKTDLFRNNDFTDKDYEFVNNLGTDKTAIAKAIISGISAGRGLIICGKDSHLMTVISSAAPAFASSLYSNVLKKTDLPMFDGIR